MASPLVVANNVASQLAANIGPTDTSLLVVAGQGVRFPTTTPGQYYYLTLIHFTTGQVEVVKVTGRSADTLTVVRGQDGTTATAFVTGSVAEMRTTAQILRELDWRTSSNAANGPALLDGAGKVADAQIPSSVMRDAEFTGASVAAVLGFTPISAAALSGYATQSWVTGLRGVANGVAGLDANSLVPVGNIPALGYLPTAGGTLSGALSVGGALSVASTVTAAQDFKSSTAAVVLATAAVGTVYLRPNGAGSASGEMQLSSGGVATTVNFTSTSDERLKAEIVRVAPRAFFIEQLSFNRWVWKDGGERGLGVIAQQVRALFPEYVHEDEDGVLSVDKASLVLEVVMGLAERVKHLEGVLADSGSSLRSK